MAYDTAIAGGEINILTENDTSNSGGFIVLRQDGTYSFGVNDTTLDNGVYHFYPTRYENNSWTAIKITFECNSNMNFYGLVSTTADKPTYVEFSYVCFSDNTIRKVFKIYEEDILSFGNSIPASEVIDTSGMSSALRAKYEKLYRAAASSQGTTTAVTSSFYIQYPNNEIYLE
ncbi:MAG: hypothetical protein J6W64_09305 [Bacilli bacterium]|nr:hypothetical protein [Bacilli bacterium]